MSSISLKDRKRLIAEDILNIKDTSVKRFTIKKLEKRATNAEKAIEEGRVYTTSEVKKQLGL